MASAGSRSMSARHRPRRRHSDPTLIALRGAGADSCARRRSHPRTGTGPGRGAARIQGERHTAQSSCPAGAPWQVRRWRVRGRAGGVSARPQTATPVTRPRAADSDTATRMPFGLPRALSQMSALMGRRSLCPARGNAVSSSGSRICGFSRVAATARAAGRPRPRRRVAR